MISDPASYEFFAGLNSIGEAIWQNDITKSKPILEWKEHVGSEGLTYIPGLQKYILMTARLKEQEENLPYNVLVFWESDNITGPYKMVHYLRDWGPQSYFPNIPAKFISPDGKKMWLCVASNYTNVESNPVQCRYGFSLHEIVFENDEFKWVEPEEKSINIAPQAFTSSNSHESNPKFVNDGKRELASQCWITNDGTGSWVRLEWDEDKSINKIRLWDLPEIDSWILSGTFIFSDGSTESLNAWTSNRAYAPSEISFETKFVSWVKFTIDQASGSVLGLGEIEVYSAEP